jgi:GT2 family glycosyltransferase
VDESSTTRTTAPLFSLITAVYDPPLDAFADTAASVLAQDHDDWEWVLVDDRSPNPAVRERLAELAAQEPRVRVHHRDQNGGIVAASSDALALAGGEFIALLDHDDVLAPQALSRAAEVIGEHADVDYVYSDQDLMSVDGRTHSPYYKPDWSPERLRHHMYTTHFSVLRRSLVEEVGGFRAGFDGSQDHDLVLRLTEKARRIEHVREVLYHWREVPGSAAENPDAKPYAWDAGVRAVQDHLDRTGIRGVVRKGRFPGSYVTDREPDLTTPVSIIIPTRGSSGSVRGERRTMVTEAVRSVIQRSRHRCLEFVVVYDSSTPDAVLDELRGLQLDGARLLLVEFTEPFNFSEKCNVGALSSSGEVLLFLNDDIEAHTDGVVEQLIAPLSEPGVGATGAKLLFESSRVQHAGLVYGSGTITHKYYKESHPFADGSYGELWMNHEVSALTGACLAVRREVFDEVGGFCEALPLNYNDVDISLKIRRAGHRLLWLHDVVLFHFESISRSSDVDDWEMDYMCARWGDYREVRESYSNGVR